MMRIFFTTLCLSIWLTPTLVLASDDMNLCLFDGTPASQNIFLPTDDGSHSPNFWTGDSSRTNLYDPENGMEYTYKTWSWIAYPKLGGAPVKFSGFAVPAVFYLPSPFANNELDWVRLLLMNFVGPDGKNNHLVYIAPGEFTNYENRYSYVIGGPDESIVIEVTESGLEPVADPTAVVVRMDGSAGTEMTTDIVSSDGSIEVHTREESLKSPHYLFNDGYDSNFRFMYERSRLASWGTFKYDGIEYYVVGSANEVRQWQIGLAALYPYQWLWSTFQIHGCMNRRGQKVHCENSMREFAAWSAWTMEDGQLATHSLNEQAAPPFCVQSTLDRPEDWSMTPVDFWVSPRSGIKYARVVHISAPSRKVDLYLTAIIDDQEMYKSAFIFPGFWEGAVDIEGTINGRHVWGSGYLEQWNQTP